jgi:hypothetical protein
MRGKEGQIVQQGAIFGRNTTPKNVHLLKMLSGDEGSHAISFTDITCIIKL